MTRMINMGLNDEDDTEYSGSPLQSCCMKMYDFLTMLSGKKYCGAEFMRMLSIISIVCPN